jgi:hypothetical protein
MASARLEENKEFLELLHSRRGCDLFRKFVKRIACDENLSFWVEVELLKNSIPTPTSTTKTETETTKQRNEALWKKFFKVGGNYELNVDSAAVETVKERLFSEDEKEANNPHIYDGVQEDVYILMLNDSFGKFKKTPEYVKYQKMRKEGTVNDPIEREKEKVEKEEEETPKQFVNKSRSYIKHTNTSSSSSSSSSTSQEELRSRRHSFTTGLFGSKKNNKLTLSASSPSSSSKPNFSLDVLPHVEEKHNVRIAETKGKEAMDGASSPPSTSPRSHHSPRFQLPSSNTSTSATSLSTTTTSNNIDARFSSTEGKEELLTNGLIPTSPASTSLSSTSPRVPPSASASTSDPTVRGVVKKPSSSIFKEQQLLDLLEPMNPADTPVSIQEQLARRKSWSGRPSDILYSSAAKRSEKRNEENSHRKPMRSRLGSSLRNIFGGGSSIAGRDGGSHRVHSTVSASLSEDDDPSVKRSSMSHLFTFQRKRTTRNPTSPLSSSPPSSPPSISPTTSAVGLRNLTGSGGQVEDKVASTFSFGTVSHATFATTPSSSSSLVRSASDLLFEAFYNSKAGETKDVSSSTSAGC